MPATDCSGLTLPTSRWRTGYSTRARCAMRPCWLSLSAASPSSEDSSPFVLQALRADGVVGAVRDSLRLGMDVDHDVSPEPFAQRQFDPFGDVVRLRHGQAGPQRAVDRHDHVLIEPADLHRVTPQDARGGADDVAQLLLDIRLRIRSLPGAADARLQRLDVHVDVVDFGQFPLDGEFQLGGPVA